MLYDKSMRTRINRTRLFSKPLPEVAYFYNSKEMHALSLRNFMNIRVFPGNAINTANRKLYVTGNDLLTVFKKDMCIPLPSFYWYDM